MEQTQDKTLSTREIITFLLFCTFFIIVVYMQLNIEKCYAMNSAIKSALASNSQDFLNVNIENDYWTWLNNFAGSLYVENYYDNYTIPEDKRHAIPNLNVIVSPVRITQRRMKMIENDDIYTKAYIKHGWASLGFSVSDEYDENVEDNSEFNGYQYTRDLNQTMTFSGKGGFIQILDIVTISQEDTIQQIQLLQNNGFINNQTRLIVIDTVIFNPYTGLFTVLDLIAIFEANGLITTKIELFDIKKKYYEGFSGFFRLVCEGCFCLLLVFYVIIELIEIIGDINGKRREWEKEEKRNEARKKRKQEAEQNDGENISPEAPKKSNEKTFENTKSNSKSKQKAAANCYRFLIGGIKEHYDDGWNWIDSAFLMLSIVAVAIWASIVLDHIKAIQNLEINEFRSVEINQTFYMISKKMLNYSQVCSINFILLFIKVLKYLASWFERVMIIFKTLSYAKSDIFYFLIMYIIIFFAFVVMCHIYYGADLTNFGTIMNSLKTLFLMLLGDLSYLDDMIVLNKVLSFFFFIAFMTSMQFILVNMFIAFISNAYSAVNGVVQKDEQQDQVLKKKHLLVKFRDFFSRIGRRLCCAQAREQKQNIKDKKDKKVADHDANFRTQQYLIKQNEERQNKDPVKSKDPFGDKDSDELESDKNGEKKKIQSSENSTNDKKGSTKISKSNGTGESQEVLSQSKININVEEGIDFDMNDEQEDDEDQVFNSRQRQEEERGKTILMKMAWDKNFDPNQFQIEEEVNTKLQSEKQEVQRKKDKELKCGRIMWASISFTLYAALYINLILFQLNVERNFWYNTALKNAILALQYSDSYNAPRGVPDILTYNQLVEFLNYSFGGIASELTQEETNFTGYYIQQTNYVLDDKFRLCFILDEMQKDYDQNSTESYFYPEYFKDDKSVYATDNFIGKVSGIKYNFTQDGYHQQGGYCQDITFDPDDYALQITNIFNDQIISDKLKQMTIEFVTFEASQYVHTYSTIEFNFPSKGTIESLINVFTMKTNQYKTQGDFIRLGFEGLYVILLMYNIFIFCQKLIKKSRQYNRWRRIEIDSLTEIEKKQRTQKKPEWIRKWDALFTSFTYFDLIYFSLAITSIVLWIMYVQFASKVDFPLPPEKENKGFIPWFYQASKLLMNYTNVVAINTIFLSVKVFDYMNKSKHMNMLSNTLYTAKEDTFYFLIIFSIFLFGFVGMAFVSFGAQLADFNSLGNAVRKLFEITIGDFDYQALEQTNSTMAVIFFFPFNILFVFILTNIFLAIINEAYEQNQLSTEDYDNINFFSSIFYCLIPVERQKNNKRKQQGIDKKSMQSDYLEVFEKLVVNLQISMSDLKAWAINCADEIKSELKKRTQLRHENREILFNKYKKMKTVEEGRSGGIGVVAHGKRFDEIECYKKRLQYWDYIRNGLQFISFQNKILNAVLKQKEKEIQEKTEHYHQEKEKTQEIYKYLALLEKPVEERLDQIIQYRKVLRMLEDEKNMLINEGEKDDGDDVDEDEKQNISKQISVKVKQD